MLRPGRSTLTHRLAFPIIAVLIALSPRSTLQVLDRSVEYRMYLPIAALAAWFACSVHALLARLTSTQRFPVMFTMVTATLCFVLGGQTIQRNQVYASRTAMWKDVIQNSPQNARAHLNLAALFEYQGQPDDAMRHTQIAIKLFGTPTVQQMDPALAYWAFSQRYAKQGCMRESKIAIIPPWSSNPRSLIY